MNQRRHSGINEAAIREAKRLGADDAVALTVLGNEQMLRFANDSLSVAKRISETELFVYLAKDRRRIVGASSNPEESSVREFVRKLFGSVRSLPEQSGYASLPTRARRYRASRSGYDARLGQSERRMAEFVEEAIEAARGAGAVRSAGAIEASVSSHQILTSTGTEGTDTRSKILLNIRSFADDESSGHGLSCASRLSDFKPAEAGRRAGEDAKRMTNPRQPEEGEYQLLMSPTVASNLVALMGSFASAFSVDAGISYLSDRMGKEVASGQFTLKDHGYVEGCLGERAFDDEGLPTRTTAIIERGTLRSYLHNLTTAKKFGVESTANAGWIEPGPWNLEVSAGDSSYAEMVSEMKRGIILTSNWYTRFKNYRTGEFSTVPRDGAYLVENGRVVSPLNGLRVSDTLERMFSSILMMSREREWVEWWEVEVPTLCPWVLVDGVSVTRAYG